MAEAVVQTSPQTFKEQFEGSFWGKLFGKKKPKEETPQVDVNAVRVQVAELQGREERGKGVKMTHEIAKTTPEEKPGFFAGMFRKKTKETPKEETSETVQLPAVEMPKETKYVEIAITNEKYGEGYGETLGANREAEIKGTTDVTRAIRLKDFHLKFTRGTNKNIGELMIDSEVKLGDTLLELAKPGNFLIKPGEPRNLVLIGSSKSTDVPFFDIKELSAVIWVGIDDKNNLNYFFRPFESCWCFDENLSRCIREDESYPIIINQENYFFVKKDNKPIWKIHIKIREKDNR